MSRLSLSKSVLLSYSFLYDTQINTNVLYQEVLLELTLEIEVFHVLFVLKIERDLSNII